MELGAEPTEHFWYQSQYLLRSASGGAAAPGLFGPWVTDDEVSWAGDLTLNYNAEALEIFFTPGSLPARTDPLDLFASLFFSLSPLLS